MFNPAYITVHMAHHEQTWQKVIKYCAYQERCTSEVEQKLSSLKVPPEEQEAMLHKLREGGYLDDERYARSFVRSKFRYQQWGLKKIRIYLHQKGLPEALIDAAADEIEAEEYEVVALKLVNGKLRKVCKSDDPTPAERQKVWRFMLQRGFEPEVIQRVLGAG